MSDERDEYALTERVVEAAQWYQRCMEDVGEGRVVRGLDEAKVCFEQVCADACVPAPVREGGDGRGALLDALLAAQRVPTHDDEGREIGLELRVGLLVSDLARLRTYVNGIARSGHDLSESAYLLLRGLATDDHQEAADAAV